MKCQAGWSTKIYRSIINLRYANDTTHGRKQRTTKSLLIKVKEESEKAGLKTQYSKNEDHGIWSHHLMSNRWGNNGKWHTFFSWAPKSLQMVTVATKLKDACSLEEKLWQTSVQFSSDVCSSDLDFIFLGSRITADGDCSHKIKRRLLLGRKAMTNLICFFNLAYKKAKTSLCRQSSV